MSTVAALCSVVLVSVLGCGSTSPSDRTTLDSIPRAAATALKAQANGAEIRAVHREPAEGGIELYEAVWLENGLEREATVKADGTVVELEREVRATDVPAAVLAAAAAELPGATAIKYVLLMNGHYEAEAKIAGQERDAVFNAEGKRVASDDDDHDDGDDVEDEND